MDALINIMPKFYDHLPYAHLIREMEDCLISYICDPQKEIKNQDIIKQYYYSFIDSYGKIPSLGELVECLDEHNQMVIADIAELEYYEEGWGIRGESEESENSEVYSSLICEWEQMLREEGALSDLWLYVREVLNELELCYELDDIPEEFHVAKDAVVIINDCQNILLEDFCFPSEEKILVFRKEKKNE